MLQSSYRVEILLRVGLWNAQNGWQMNFKLVKRSIFVIDSYLKDHVFTAVKRDAKL